MDRLRIVGKKKLQGTVQVSGAKNAALPILFAPLLTGDAVELTRVPDLQDIRFTFQILEGLGVSLQSDLTAGRAVVRAENLSGAEAPYDLVRKMRASVIVLGPLLARTGRARVSLPGGCAIGARPINFHLSGLKKLGAEIELTGGYVEAHCKRLTGSRVTLEFPSVGATENLLMAATLAKGTTLLENCAREPEIVDLAVLLRSMGAKIQGEGSEKIEIQGVDALHGASHAIMGDRIEAGTYLIAGLITGGRVRVEGIAPGTLDAVLDKLTEAGVQIETGADWIEARSTGAIKGVDFTTLPFPGFPTDMQAQFMALMLTARGASVISENIFENRFMHVPELMRLGADITIRGNVATVRGVERLTAAPLMATDLRASASLVLAALAAEGETIVNRIYHLDRGYESLEKKLSSLGAEVERIK